MCIPLHVSPTDFYPFIHFSLDKFKWIESNSGMEKRDRKLPFYYYLFIYHASHSFHQPLCTRPPFMFHYLVVVVLYVLNNCIRFGLNNYTTVSAEGMPVQIFGFIVIVNVSGAFIFLFCGQKRMGRYGAEYSGSGYGNGGVKDRTVQWKLNPWIHHSTQDVDCCYAYRSHRILK